MSDPFTDAYRPDWKPKGFGWWDDASQKKYLSKILKSKEEIDDLGFWHRCYAHKLIEYDEFVKQVRNILKDQ